MVLMAFLLAALLYHIGSFIKRKPTDMLIYAVLILLAIDGILAGPVKFWLGNMASVVYLFTIIGFALFILLRKLKRHLQYFFHKLKRDASGR
ncbi:MAG: hypothetical protein CO187_00345 [Zetaproteobacteria bacterium CG_4_9_14_3_um_filter_53_7]|nr:MAG: hypothetical protein CO187_00345 [Zetaproteobacteria bacterium CG_4_9_14_3_um_filter_53_7]